MIALGVMHKWIIIRIAAIKVMNLLFKINRAMHFYTFRKCIHKMRLKYQFFLEKRERNNLNALKLTVVIHVLAFCDRHFYATKLNVEFIPWNRRENVT
jgi:hypothetical protein